MNFNPPVVRMQPSVVPILQRRSLSDLFTVTDADPNSEILRYQIRDNGPGAGQFLVGNEVVEPNSWREFPSSQLNVVTYKGAAAFAKETISIRAFDGLFWSNVATSSITTGNVTPVLTAEPGRIAANDVMRIDKQITYSDGDGDPAIRYLFVDRQINADGGQFVLRGEEKQQGKWFTIEAGDLPNLMYRGAQQGGEAELIGVMVWDGYSFSEPIEFEMATTSQPIITGTSESVVTDQRKPATSFFNVSDPDGDPIVSYVVADYRINANGGYWEYQGVRQESAKFFTVPAANLGELFYVGGSVGPQSEEVGIQVFDGFEFSPVSNIEIETIVRPMVEGRDAEVKRGHYLNMATGGTANTSGQMADGDPILDFLGSDEDDISQLLFVDRFVNTNGGHFVFKGDRLPSGRWFKIQADELPDLEYRGGVFGPQTEPISAMAFSNGVWSEETTFQIDTLKNLYRPEVNLFDVTARLGVVMSLEGMFTWEDLDGDILESVSIYDTGSAADSGYFTINGVRQNAQVWINVPFDEVSTVKYHLSNLANTEKIRMFASDGRAASVVETATIDSISTPVIESIDNDVSLDSLESIPVGDFFQQLDSGPSLTHWQVYDEIESGATDRSGRLFLREPGGGNNGEQLQGSVVHTLTAEEFSRLEFQGAESDLGRQLDPMLVRGTNNITGWTEWHRVNLNTDAVGPDALTSGTRWFNSPFTGQEDPTVITYMFIDGNRVDGPYPPLPTYYSCPPDPECNNPTALNQPQREAIREVHAYYETVANVDFVEVPWTSNASTAAITWGAADLPAGVGAWAYFPNGAVPNGFNAKPGDIWFNNLAGYDPTTNVDVSLGSEFRGTAYHELGHAIGLKHPHSLDPVLSVFLDFEYNTIMSYQRDNSFNPHTGYSEASSTANLYDNMELQRVYGLNETNRPGNDHYGNFFSGSYPHFINNNEQHQTTLYDTGGIDTFNFTNHTADESIDLREGQWSTVNGVPMSLRIQYLTTIENARGGSGDDNIRGNEISNLLFGNDGDDVLQAGGDNDIIRGGRGGDTYIWSLGDGRDLVREEGNGILDEIDFAEFYDPSGSIDSLEDDFTFRRFGETLRIDLTLDQREGQGTMQIVDFGQTGSEVEIMRIHGLLGDKIGNDIDLKSIYNTASAGPQRYYVTDIVGENGGYIASPVT